CCHFGPGLSQLAVVEMMIAGEVDCAADVCRQCRLHTMDLCGREPGGWVALLLAQLVKLTVLLLVRLGADEFKYADGLVFKVNSGTLFQFSNQSRIEFLTRAFELVHRAAP